MLQNIVCGAVLLAASLFLSGCASQPQVWAHYDQCSAQTSFVAMVECGKQRRLAACQPNSCSAGGNAFMQYADALALSVKNKEMTESDAMRRFAEYKTQVIANERRDQAVRDSSDRTCIVNGNMVNCF